MLATPRFKNAETQADFLELVVGRALQGKQTRGSDIAKALFEHKDEINVRSNANHLRKTLERYYSQEGIEDLVLIALPKPPRERSVKLPEGVAYTPEFFYNPRHAGSLLTGACAHSKILRPSPPAPPVRHLCP